MTRAHRHTSERSRGGRLAAALLLSSGLAFAAASAQAEKVGVAAAVSPDAFSSLAGKPQTQLNIGKSIFYNERINTTGSGLVQVLLVDGSTFTVGPGSDLVIDRFVYDPKKGTGQIAASFSKGVARFVGGKISKNEGGVNIDTPAGALAIRGGIAYLQYSNPKNFAFLFVFGDYLKMGGKTIYEPGNGFFNVNGQLVIKPFNAALINSMMASLSNSNTAGNTGSDGTKPTPQPKMFGLQSLNQLIVDATTEQIVVQAQEAAANQDNGLPPCTELCDGGPGLGYAGGIYNQFSTGQNDDDPIGVVASRNYSQVAFTPTEGYGPPSFSANFQLSAGAPWEPQQGGIDILFGNETQPHFWNRRSWVDPFDGGVSAINAPGGISIYGDAGPDQPHQIVGFPLAALVSSDFGWGFGHNLDLCNDCYAQWGTFVSLVSFTESPDNGEQSPPVGLFNDNLPYSDITTVAVLGWWIAGDIPAVGQLPITGTASYAGDTIATVATDLFGDGGWTTYVATGDVEMNWNFGKRTGNMTVSNFDAGHFEGGLQFGGKMCAPGITSCGTTPDGAKWNTPNGNHFGGPLKGTLPNFGPSEGLSPQAQALNGFALGSFVRGPSNYQTVGDLPVPISRSIPQGAIGNWGIGNDRYMASGVFGASRQ